MQQFIRKPALVLHQVQHDSEQALLQAALQWLGQSPERALHAKELLSHIRFPLIPMEDLVSLVLPAVRALLPEGAGCEELVEEALGYHARPSAQPLLQTSRTTLRGGVEQLLLIGGEVLMDANEHGWIKKVTSFLLSVDLFYIVMLGCVCSTQLWPF